MHLDEIVFGVPLMVGVVLVVCSALGASELSAEMVEQLDELGSHDHDADGDGLLGVLGIGRVPLVIVSMLLSLLFGGVGLAITSPVSVLLGERGAFLVALPLAALVAFAGTAAGTRLLARIMPGTESYAPRQSDLVGLHATVLVLLGPSEAIVRTWDAGGAEQRVRCVVPGRVVRLGEELLLVAYEPDCHSYLGEKLA